VIVAAPCISCDASGRRLGTHLGRTLIVVERGEQYAAASRQEVLRAVLLGRVALEVSHFAVAMLVKPLFILRLFFRKWAGVADACEGETFTSKEL
jgi:hypothetical protein